MPAKPSAPPSSPPVEASAPAAAAAPAADSKARSLSGFLTSLVPVAVVLIATPLLTWAVAQFLLMPRLEKRLAAAVADSTAPAKPQHRKKLPASRRRASPALPQTPMSSAISS